MTHGREQRRRAARSGARDRLRGGFLERTSRQLGALELLLSEEAGEDAELLDALGADLRRLGAAAESLGLLGFSAVASEAAESESMEQLRRSMPQLSEALRSTPRTRLFPSLVLLARGAEAEALRRASAASCELLHVVPSWPELSAEARSGGLQAVVAPIDQLGSLPVDLEDIPVYGYGRANELAEARGERVAELGGLFLRPLDLPAIIEHMRLFAAPSQTLPSRALVLSDNSALRKHLVRLLRQDGLEVRSAGEPEQMLSMLERDLPDVLLLGAQRPPATLETTQLAARLAGSRQLAILAIAPRAEALRFLEAGAVDIVDPSASLSMLMRRVRAHLRRARAQPRWRDRDTGLDSRARLLGAVDQALVERRRTGEEISLGVLSLDGAAERSEAEGGDAALGALARAATATLREGDRVGRVGPHALMVLLRRCGAGTALARLEAVRAAWAEAGSEADLLLGAVDSSRGTDRLLRRLDEAVAAARSSR